MSPRCVNCHIEGESPLQGDDSHPHTMRVKRGADGRGTPAVRCRACHQSTNLAAMHAPPGVEEFRLPVTRDSAEDLSRRDVIAI